MVLLVGSVLIPFLALPASLRITSTPKLSMMVILPMLMGIFVDWKFVLKMTSSSASPKIVRSLLPAAVADLDDVANLCPIFFEKAESMQSISAPSSMRMLVMCPLIVALILGELVLEMLWIHVLRSLTFLSERGRDTFSGLSTVFSLLSVSWAFPSGGWSLGCFSGIWKRCRSVTRCWGTLC